MRLVKIATCTSGEPVSVLCVLYCEMISSLASFAKDITTYLPPIDCFACRIKTLKVAEASRKFKADRIGSSVRSGRCCRASDLAGCTHSLMSASDYATSNSRTTGHAGSCGSRDSLVPIQMNNDRASVRIKNADWARRERDPAGSMFKYGDAMSICLEWSKVTHVERVIRIRIRISKLAWI